MSHCFDIQFSLTKLPLIQRQLINISCLCQVVPQISTPKPLMAGTSITITTTTTTTTTTPLLPHPPPSPSNTLALLVGRVAGRTRGQPSTLIREAAALLLEERRADWGYSRPVVCFDVAWNLAFIIVSFFMLCWTLKERPNVPIRVWLCGYALQCLVHVVLVCLEYRRRNLRRGRSVEEGGGSGRGEEEEGEGTDSEEEESGSGYRIGSRTRFAKRCESINTMTSFLWWIIGFYWIVSGGETLCSDAPRLYWLAVVFLAFDVFFAIFCVALACMIGIALCCCLPCIIAILYAVAGQEGATESDLTILPRYNYQVSGNKEKLNAGAGSMIPIPAPNGDLTDERVLLSEDAECCICLSSYEDGQELHVLSCGHHFHSPCIVKWLKIKSSCPLCKCNILKGNSD